MTISETEDRIYMMATESGGNVPKTTILWWDVATKIINYYSCFWQYPFTKYPPIGILANN
jgi:hypothetical protein